MSKLITLSNLTAFWTKAKDYIATALSAHTSNGDIHVTAAQKTAWDAKSDFSGSYNDLSDTPTIPAAYTHPSSHPASMITGLSTVATSGKYSDLTGTPTIPTTVAQLSDAGNYALKTDIASTYKYKGTKATVDELPATGNTVGDVWNVETTDMNYGWTGSAWDPLGSIVTIETATNAEIEAIVV